MILYGNKAKKGCSCAAPVKKAASGIHIKPENKGKFTSTKKATGKSTEELTHSKNPVTKKRAIFAQNAKKWKHEDGGSMDMKCGGKTKKKKEVGGVLYKKITDHGRME